MAQIGWKTNRDGLKMTECQGCGRHANENRIDPIIRDVFERVGAGEIMPAGECLSCGAVAHLIPLYNVEEARTAERAQLEELAEFLEETHRDEIANRHHGDAGGSLTCSYCQAIKAARRLLKRGAPEDERPPCERCGALVAWRVKEDGEIRRLCTKCCDASKERGAEVSNA